MTKQTILLGFQLYMLDITLAFNRNISKLPPTYIFVQAINTFVNNKLNVTTLLKKDVT